MSQYKKKWRYIIHHVKVVAMKSRVPHSIMIIHTWSMKYVQDIVSSLVHPLHVSAHGDFLWTTNIIFPNIYFYNCSPLRYVSATGLFLEHWNEHITMGFIRIKLVLENLVYILYIKALFCYIGRYLPYSLFVNMYTFLWTNHTWHTLLYARTNVTNASQLICKLQI